MNGDRSDAADSDPSTADDGRSTGERGPAVDGPTTDGGTGDGPASATGDASAPTAGFLLAGVAHLAIVAHLVDEQEATLLWIGAGITALAALAFVGRRHDLVERRIGVAVAGLASIGVIGYGLVAPSAGLTDHAPVAVAMAVAVAGCGGVAMAVADYRRLHARELARLGLVATRYAAIGIVGLFTIAVVGAVLLTLYATGTGEEPDAIAEVVVGNLGLGLGAVAVAIGYLELSGRDRSFIDVRVPTARDVAWTIGGCILIVGALVTLSVVMQSIGVEGSEHSVLESAEENPEILLVLVLASFLLIGPGEELIFRNVVQKGLYDAFSRPAAVVVASVIFAIVHFPAYGTGAIDAVSVSVGMVFALSLVLGFVYERTDNLLVPAFVHGAFNAIQFAVVYAQLTGGIPAA